MNGNLKGNIGEAKVRTHFTTNGYEIYLGSYGHETFDMVVYKGGSLQTVSVKTTSNKRGLSYHINISQSTRGKVLGFNNIGLDLLVVYILPEDTIIVLDAKKINSKKVICLRPEDECTIGMFEKGKRRQVRDNKGKNNVNAKLNEEKVKEIRKLYKPYSREFSQAKLAKVFGVSREAIREVISGRVW